MKTRDAAAPSEGSSTSARVIAEQLAVQAERFRRDADTEARTAALLSVLCGDGFEVLHDLSLPQSKAHVDHLVLGTTGAFTIDSRHYRKRLSVEKGGLWCGTYSLAKELTAAKADAAQVAQVLNGVAGLTPVVEPVMAVHALAGQDAVGKDGHLVIDGVHVVAAERLLEFLKSRPHALNLPDVTQLATEAKATMRPAIGAKHRRATAARIPNRPDAAVPDAPMAPKRRSRDRDLAQLAIGIAVIAVLGWLVPTVIGRVSDDAASAPRATAAAGGFALPTGEFTCPAPGLGWSHDLAWPAGTDLAAHHVEWATTAEGPWRVVALDPARGLPPLTTVYYRSRAGAAAGSPVEATTTAAAPDTPC